MSVAGDSPEERREALKLVYREARGCTRCAQLAQTRKQVVFGAGDANADVMFVGEAPGQHEDEMGVPFVGRAGMLLDELLGEIGIAREDVFIANVLKCRPPQNRNPNPDEIDNCSPWLWRQLELIQPIVVVALGAFATRLLRGDQAKITQVRGQDEVRLIGPRAVRLYPVFHPAAALRATSQKDLLRRDIQRLPEIVALGAPPQPGPIEPVPEIEPEVPATAPIPPSGAEPLLAPTEPPTTQLGLF